MPLRIGMVAYTHYESDPRVRREAEALAARGDEVVVYCLDDDKETAELNGVQIRRVRIPRYRGSSSVAYVRSYLRFFTVAGARIAAAHVRQPFEILHVHTMPDFMVFTGLLPRLAGAKVVLDMHDLMPDLYAVKFGLNRAGSVVSMLKGVQRAATSFADAVICVHEPQYNLLLRDGVPARKLNIVMNAPDPTLFPPRKKEPRIKEGGEVRVVYHGTILHRYGVDIAVRAFAKAREQNDRLVFSIFGDGDFLPEVQKLKTELGLSDEVLRISGRRHPLAEMASMIRDAHIGLIANRDDQEDSVLPTKLLEYVAIGIPVVAPKTRCIGRYFSDEQVELVPVEDVDALAAALVRLADDKARRKALVAGARAWEAEYGFEVQKRLLFRVFDGLCFEKIRSEKKARQKQVDGAKTGTRETPPKRAANPISPA